MPQVPKKRRPIGLYKGQLTVPDDFNDPLPDEITGAFEGLGDLPNMLRPDGPYFGQCVTAHDNIRCRHWSVSASAGSLKTAFSRGSRRAIANRASKTASP